MDITFNRLAELGSHLSSSEADKLSSTVLTEDDNFETEYDLYVLTKSYFDCKEYQRAYKVSSNCKSQKLYFLRLYSWYMSGQKKQRDDQVGFTSVDKVCNQELYKLEKELKENLPSLDGYCLYLYGVVLKELDFKEEAIKILVDAINKRPLLWCAWEELIPLCSDVEMVMSLSLPDHWIKTFFLASVHNELHCAEEALVYCQSLKDLGFQSSLHVKSLIAFSYYNVRDYDNAEDYFEELHKAYPLRLENMDIYSNILYVKEKKIELSDLAHHVSSIDKFSVISCYVVGNYYSLIGQHKKALRYFQRALTLNPRYLFIWTLIGHEYMELANTSAAIEAYRKAIEINRNDFRAWYGLGQAYEILKMPYYSLFYYKRAQALRPNDSRMWTALGDINITINKLDDAKRCFLRALSVGVVVGDTCLKLARLMEKSGDESGAEVYFLRFIEISTSSVAVRKDTYLCHRYLANYYLKKANYDSALYHAQKCCEFTETCEEGKSVLLQLSRLAPTAKPVSNWNNVSNLDEDYQNQSSVMNLTDIGEDSMALP
ncbi:uncharacterized protein TRIADDRAFT_21637 [Trichoplax adhaerens]|uniref:Cdc23 domain-containing protein n=1 Tax=Trichoplax adhaerens TaxID=10228 RepID=B3RNP3_TRIAD|nr:hypothetical protein TRIADDRAFT_21637 [Trichoplax adhaerens]EDV27493.1 hypothetical protein TRIADDRAFT_21637 [Trichoplax adhaerens]|eukprot:XP_002109327.1 hypothetical protein TRIADDRAFT_21637 [Trichoplax adhaerens]